MYEYYIIVMLFVLAFVLQIYAQNKVDRNYNIYSKEQIESGLTGEKIAKLILERAGIFDVSVVKINGKLSDNYNHKKKTVSLSSEVFSTSSIASAGIAAHEVGHAIQYQEHYMPIKVRNFLIPISNVISKIFWPIIIVALIFDFAFLAGVTSEIFLWIVIVVLGLPVFIQLITLPVEYDASNRAKRILEEYDICSSREMGGVRAVLSSAGLTYLASFLLYLVQLLRVLAIFFLRRRD